MNNHNNKNLVVSSYDITYEPIKSEYKENLPRKIREKMDDMFHNISTNPQSIIDEYSKVPKKHQNNPILLNYLSAAYSYKRDIK